MKLSRKGAWVTRLITACTLALGLAGALAAGASAASAAPAARMATVYSPLATASYGDTSP